MSNVWLASAKDIERLNEIAAHPEVKPFITESEAIDFAQCPPSTMTVMSNYGFIFFIPVGDDWEFHTAFLPEGRGRHALSVAKKCAELMFKIGANRLVTYTPDDCPRARPPKTFGFKKVGRQDNYIRGVGADKWALDAETWRRKCPQAQ